MEQIVLIEEVFKYECKLFGTMKGTGLINEYNLYHTLNKKIQQFPLLYFVSIKIALYAQKHVSLLYVGNSEMKEHRAQFLPKKYDKI